MKTINLKKYIRLERDINSFVVSYDATDLVLIAVVI
jgi:hypothetical protein